MKPLHQVGGRLLEDRSRLRADLRLSAVADVVRCFLLAVILSDQTTLRTCALAVELLEKMFQTSRVVGEELMELGDGELRKLHI